MDYDYEMDIEMYKSVFEKSDVLELSVSRVLR